MVTPTQPLFIFILLLFFHSIIGCPNEKLKLVAVYKQKFHLEAGLWFVAIGSKEYGRWGIGILQPLREEAKNNKFECHRSSLGVGPPIDTVITKGKLWRGKKRNTMCCVGRVKENMGADNPYEILPESIMNELQFTGPSTGYARATEAFLKDLKNKPNFVWFEKEYDFIQNRYVALLSPLTLIKKTEDETSEIFEAGYDEPYKEAVFFQMTMKVVTTANYPVPRGPTGKDEDRRCYAPRGEECDTGMEGELVAFLYDVSSSGAQQRISFAYSDDGRFKLDKLLPDLASTDSANKQRPIVYYFAIKDWFCSEPGPETDNTGCIGSIPSGKWILGSSCASCPSTSFKMTISQKEAAMNKERMEKALSVSLGLKAPKGFSGSVGYTYKVIQESAATLTSGRATTITAVCNGFYIYYWAINAGGWTTSESPIPSSRFYCTDWPIPPKCYPRVEGKVHPESIAKRFCQGNDVIKDFCIEDAIPLEMISRGDREAMIMQHDARSERAKAKAAKLKAKPRKSAGSAEEVAAASGTSTHQRRASISETLSRREAEFEELGWAAKWAKQKWQECAKLDPKVTTDGWWPKHEGRPKPVRIVGHDTERGKLGKKPLKVEQVKGTPAHMVDFSDNLYGNKKGIFDADVIFDYYDDDSDDDDAESTNNERMSSGYDAGYRRGAHMEYRDDYYGGYGADEAHDYYGGYEQRKPEYGAYGSVYAVVALALVCMFGVGLCICCVIVFIALLSYFKMSSGGAMYQSCDIGCQENEEP